MDTVEFLKTVNRLCKKNRSCAECPIFCKKGMCMLRRTVMLCDASDASVESSIEEMISIVEQWAKDHQVKPIKTRQSEFLKRFPDASVSDGTLDIRPCIIEKSVKCIALEGKDCDNCRREYWLEEVTDND